jgi:hypothetical protein
MSHTSSTPTPTALAELADQWTVLREHYAFLAEALLRLMADHPDLAPDVIQGAIQNRQDTMSKVAAFTQALRALREQAHAANNRPDSG